MRDAYLAQLSELNYEMTDMGNMVEMAIDKAVKAFVNKDMELASQAVNDDDVIDEKEKRIEDICLKLLLKQQPVAKDLREVSAALKMITDMERIGDHAADISEITLLLNEQQYIKNPKYIVNMADITTNMVKASIEAFVTKDIVKAQRVIDQDDEVDNLFCGFKKELIRLIHQNSEVGEQAADLLMIAKYFERIGDHATNIAEWAIFSVTGIHE